MFVSISVEFLRSLERDHSWLRTTIYSYVTMWEAYTFFYNNIGFSFQNYLCFGTQHVIKLQHVRAGKDISEGIQFSSFVLSIKEDAERS